MGSENQVGPEIRESGWGRESGWAQEEDGGVYEYIYIYIYIYVLPIAYCILLVWDHISSVIVRNKALYDIGEAPQDMPFSRMSR